MKKSILLVSVAIFVFGIVSESWAASNGECNDDGSCLWSLDDNGKLTISTKDNATGVAMKNYGATNKIPWYNSRTSITSVEVEDGITNIGDYSFFQATNLTSITIPDSVTSIGSAAFYSTSKLSSINIPNSVTSIGDSAFQQASSLLTSITIPDSVTSIGNGAFRNNNLWELIIPDSWANSNPTLDSGMFNEFNNSYSQTTNIVCEGDTDKCEIALSKFFRSNDCPQSVTNANLTCNCTSSCISPSLIVSATSALQCTGVGYIWNNNTCRRKTEEECNEYDNYYYTGGRCQTLPNTKTNCEGAEFVWASGKCSKINKSYCTNKGQVFWDNKCMDEYPFSKKHWTPAEVNKWLYDDNNTITITFKKQ